MSIAQKTRIKSISASRLRKLGGKIPYSSILPQKRKSIRKRKPTSAHWNPVPGALDKRSHFTKDGREKLYGVDKTNRRREIFERSDGRCEATHMALVFHFDSSPPYSIVEPVRCSDRIVFEDERPNSMEWSHKQHGAKKSDTMAGGIASCKKCHDDFHNGRLKI